MRNNSLFWEFKTSASEPPSVLYGTIHLGTPACLTHWDKVKSFIDQYDHVYTESAVDQAAAVYLQPFSLLDGDIDVHDYVSLRRWKNMRTTFLKYTQLDIDQFKMFRPLFIISQIQARLAEADGATPLDYKIWQYAESHGKKVDGVESPQEQVEILKRLDMAQQYQQLIRMSKGISKTRKKLNQVINAYTNQDIHSLYQLTKGSLGTDRTTLIGERNVVMADRLITIHKSRPSFFSFGAGHLSGGNGVLRLLKKAGAVVRPL